jgi:CheY-like chemotaxis protein
VDLRELIEESVNSLRATLPSAIELELELSEDCDPVFAHRVALSQVVSNLLSNAVAAMPEGGTLRVRLSRENRQIADGITGLAVLEVKDTGVGMDAKTQERVFEPFFTTKAMGEGTGLGLATVHGIVSSLEGTIALESEKQRGTCFTVRLPTRKAPLRELQPVEDAPVRESFSGSVLLVDDDATGRMALRSKLEQLGFRVQSASSVPLALELIGRSAGSFDLLVTDNQMPGTSGLALVASVRAAGHRLPVLMITGFPDGSVQERARELEVNALLAKPFGHEELLRALSSALN